MKRILILLLWVAMTCAQDIALESLDDDDDSPDSRKKKHHLFFGGLKGLSKFLSIKIKVIISVVSIALVTVLVIKAFGAFKLFGLGGCPEPIILTHETPTFYSSDPHHHHHHDHHEHYSPEEYSGPVYTDYSSSSGPGLYPYPPASDKRTDMTGGRQLIVHPDIGDLAFRVLGVNTDACRRRFVCEMDERAKTNMLLQFAFGIVSRGLFEKYRDVDNKPANYEECAQLHEGCSGEDIFGTPSTGLEPIAADSTQTERYNQTTISTIEITERDI